MKTCRYNATLERNIQIWSANCSILSLTEVDWFVCLSHIHFEHLLLTGIVNEIHSKSSP